MIISVLRHSIDSWAKLIFQRRLTSFRCLDPQFLHFFATFWLSNHISYLQQQNSAFFIMDFDRNSIFKDLSQGIFCSRFKRSSVNELYAYLWKYLTRVSYFNLCEANFISWHQKSRQLLTESLTRMTEIKDLFFICIIFPNLQD